MKRFLHAVQVLVLGFVGTAFADPFQNGSFEVGTLTANPCNISLPVGSTAITGWTVINGAIDYVTPSCWNASSGTRSLDLIGSGSSNVGGIMQQFDTVFGQAYQVIFDIAGNPSGGFAQIKNLTVTINGVPQSSYTYDIGNPVYYTTSTMGWYPRGFQFIATSTSTTIGFQSNAPDTFAGMALDNVRVLPVPAGAWQGLGGNVYSGNSVPFGAPVPPMICSDPASWSASGGPFSYPTILSGFGVQGPLVATYAVPQGTSIVGICGNWEVRTTAAAAGSIPLHYQFQGDSSSFTRTADLRAFVIPALPLPGPNPPVFTNLVLAPPAGFSPFPGGGAASFNFSGTHTFTVQAGDIYGFTMAGSNFDFADFLNGRLTVTGTAIIGTGSLFVNSNANPAPAGSPVTFTATADGNTSVPTGTVGFYDGTLPIPGCEAVPLVPTTATTSTAACTTSTLGLGGHGIGFLYSGDMTFAPAGNMLGQSITAAASANPLTLIRAVATDATHTTLIGRFDLSLATTITFDAFTAAGSCGAAQSAPTLGTFVVSIADPDGYFAVSIPGVSPTNFLAVQVTTPSLAMSPCLVSSADNDYWPKALNVAPFSPIPQPNAYAESSTVSDYIDLAGKARWYKFSIAPGQKINVTLSGLPADYDVVVFKDIKTAFEKLATPTDATSLNRLNAEFAPSTFSPSTFSPSTFSPSTFSPDAYAPSTFSPSTFSSSLFAPSTFSPSTFSPSTFSPSTFSPSTFSPSTFSPSTFSPSTFSPSTFSPSTVFNFNSLDVQRAFSSAQTSSIIGVSATPGTGNEVVVVNSWNETGEFYVRVAGRGDAFSTSAPFTVSVLKGATTCTGVTPLPPPSIPRGDDSGPNVKTVILLDSTKIALDTLVGGVTLQSKLDAFKARSEIGGAIVYVNADSRVQQLKAQADNHKDCPYATNLVAEEIKSIVDTYRKNNPNLRYVVIVGNDSAIPFFRYPDETLIGQESGYDPPVASATISDASLINDFLLSQDAYGAKTRISMRSILFPVPGLAVGRLIETPAEIAGLIDGYTAANGVVVPTSSLVTGYDFLADVAGAVTTELQSGTGVAPQTLVTANGVSPQDPQSWNATQLSTALLGSRKDIIFLAGHFSANSALAADFTTSLLTSDLAASSTNFTNSIVFSAGCHAGYNIVDSDAIQGVTVKLDWAQAFAQKGATLVAGTGYQYGDTDFVEYSERLYKNFARQLRAGTSGTTIAVGEALNRAKVDYIAVTPDMRGIHLKAVLEATVFGLPMLSVNMPAGRGAIAPDGGAINPTLVTPATSPGAQLGLRTADYPLTLLNPSTALGETCLKTDFNALNPTTPPVPPLCATGYTRATWFNGPDGVVSNPAEPVLPLYAINVTPTTNDIALRGVGFLGGTYADTTGLVPLTGAPTTEIRGVHTSFSSPYFFPMRLATTNYFAALFSGLGGTRLLVTPAQHRADNLALGTSALRKYTGLNLRLYYSGNTTLASISAAPTIVSVNGATNGSGGVKFNARVVGDPDAAIHEVWVTYTDDAGTWASLPLTQCTSPAPAACGTTTDTQIWMGELSSVPTSIKYIVQAANGVGLVSLDDNLGAYYSATGGTPPSAPVATTMALVPPPPTTITYGQTPDVTASLAATSGPIPNASVSISAGGTSASTTTDANGFGTKALARVAPGSYQIVASYAGSASYLPATASSPLTVLPAQSFFVDDVSTIAPAAFLVAPVGANPQQPISQELVTFAVSQSGNLLKTFTVRTDINGRAALPPTGLPIGTYNVLASFAGSELYLGSSLAISNLQVTTPCPLGEKTKVRWHYSANGSPGNWTSDRQISCTDGSVVFATQATEGTLNLAPDTAIKFGFALQLPGNKTHFNALINTAKAVFPLACVSGAIPSPTSLTVTIPNQTLLLDSKSWNPSSNKDDPSVYQGTGTIPNACGGGQVRLNQGGSFSAYITLN